MIFWHVLLEKNIFSLFWEKHLDPSGLKKKNEARAKEHNSTWSITAEVASDATIKLQPKG